MDELRRATNRNVKVDVFLGKRAHLVVEAERVLAGLLGRKDKVAAPLLFALENDLATRALDDVVDIKRTARLDLQWESVMARRNCAVDSTHRKVESNLLVVLLGVRGESGLLVGRQLVRQRRGRDIGDHAGNDARGDRRESHRGGAGRSGRRCRVLEARVGRCRCVLMECREGATTSFGAEFRLRRPLKLPRLPSRAAMPPRAQPRPACGPSRGQATPGAHATTRHASGQVR